LPYRIIIISPNWTSNAWKKKTYPELIPETRETQKKEKRKKNTPNKIMEFATPNNNEEGR
jgi:hypothetical protein